jgi:hypothetical protein
MTTDLDELRKSIASTILDSWRAAPDDATFGQLADRFTAALLAWPLAEPLATLNRICALADQWDRSTEYRRTADLAARLRDALNGQP